MCPSSYAVTNDEVSGDNCPKLVLFSLGALQNYLKEAEAEFDRMGIPESERGIAVLPVIHEGETRFNVLFTPCVQDANKECHHILNQEKTVDEDPLDWILGGLNEGHLWP